MKHLIYITFFLIQLSFSQQAFQNFGNIQIHQNAEIGFHIDLVNNGTFNENLGLAGFYNIANPLTISGTQVPRFFDMEVDVVQNLLLNINTEIVNSLSYLSGDIITPRDNPNISLDFLDNAINVLEENLKKTDGYASYTGSLEFTLPIGDDNKLRPLITPFQNSPQKLTVAYFNEDPNFPSTFSGGFDTSVTEVTLNTINNREFWDFNAPNQTQVTLTWDGDSNISSLVSDLMNLRIVGWHIADGEWKDLGNTNITGNLDVGTISSEIFKPSDFEILTFGAFKNSTDLVIYNFVSSNGDFVNETFIIEGIELFNNTLKIYNRWGKLVYETENYKNTWKGKSNKKVFESLLAPIFMF